MNTTGGERTESTVQSTVQSTVEGAVDLTAAVVRDSPAPAAAPAAAPAVAPPAASHSEALRKSEEMLRLALEAARMGSWQWDIRTGEITWSDNLEEVHGMAPGSFDGTFEGFLKIVHTEDREAFTQAVGAAVEACSDFLAEFRVVRPDGSVQWMEGRGKVFTDGEGRPARMVGLGTDVTERKGREERQHFLEEFIRRTRRIGDPEEVLWQAVCALGEHLGVARCVYNDVDLDAGLVTVHRDYLRDASVGSVRGEYSLASFGEEIIGALRAGETVVVEDAATDPRTAPLYAERYVPIGVRAFIGVPLMKDGRLICSLSPQTDAPRAWTPQEVTLLEDVVERTWLAYENARLYRAAREEVEERRRAEAALRERVAEIEALMEVAPAAIWIAHDPECQHITGNRRAYEILRMPQDSNVSMSPPSGQPAPRYRMFRGREEVAPGEMPMQQAAAHGVEVRGTELEVLFEDGSTVTIFGNASPLFDAEGRVRGAVATFMDVTEQKRYLAQIESLNTRLSRAMFETHHRVKNNLQTIAALVDLQVTTGAESVPMGELSRIARYIRVLAGVHDLLTHEAKADPEAKEVSAKAMLEQLLPLLRTVINGNRLDFEAEDFRLAARQASSLAVLVQECVSNAVKHGGRRVGVTLRARPGRAVLEVSDDGPGFPAGFTPATGGTGIELIESLSRWDLQGEITYANRPEGGAVVTVTFPVSGS